MTTLPQISHAEVDGVVVLQPVGEFDIATVDMLRSAFLDAVGPEHDRVVVDLSDTTFVDSMALGVMVGISRHVNSRGGWLRLVGPRENIRSVLRITGLDKVFGTFDTVEQAVSHDDDSENHGPERELV